MKKSDAPAPTPGGWGDRVQLEPEEAVKLLPCPLCHAAPETLLRGFYYGHDERLTVPAKKEAVLCPTCACRAPADAWNTRASTAPSEINHFEDTPAGRIDWKMEAERANRLLAASERAAPAQCDAQGVRAAVIEECAKIAERYADNPCSFPHNNTLEAFNRGMNHEAGCMDSADCIALAIRALSAAHEGIDHECPQVP